jgi:phage-related protein
VDKAKTAGVWAAAESEIMNPMSLSSDVSEAVSAAAFSCPAPDALSELLSGLNESNANVTREFLALAGALQAISQRARELTKLSHQATDLAAQICEVLVIPLWFYIPGACGEWG